MTPNGKSPGAAETFRFDEFWREWQEHDPEGGIAVPPKTFTLTLKRRDAYGAVILDALGKPIMEEVTYQLPATLPAITVLRLLRNPARSNAEYFEAGEAIFGADAIERWALDGKGIDEVASIVQVAEGLIRGSTHEEVFATARKRGQKPTPRKKKTLTSSGIGS